ncbi:SDR family NAD(P)-dependent oxidoreductase [Stenotrophobium rhamnosiphilum]|uniref:Glucose 1-dehydrogenase n=1 Tax=Stenotrophobium rhamnosiphilum TaxID=2029166 RepID=A0A2T5MEA6_9GAMM|nr:SDR family NAD(P)-dependent oxidoreductase [Stenotrophobium rhamnosiphilum]PTU30879.1 glucose 1-dehydrogenase [Stenotrophobium rhamnosiphilum]
MADKNNGATLKPCAVVVGAGSRQGIGGALCARFAAAGLHVYATGRSADKLEPLATEIRTSGGSVTAVTADAANPADVQTLFDRITEAGHVPELVVFNASELNMPTSFAATTPEFVEKMWRTCCFGGFVVGHEAIERMLPQKRGTLIFTGASASLRGRPKFGAFAAAKAGLRIHAQAFAREFGPEGIHVAHVVVDGIVGGDRANKFGYGLGKAFLFTKGEDGALHPDAIAESYWQLHCQHRSAWTHELDLRPYKETF